MPPVLSLHFCSYIFASLILFLLWVGGVSYLDRGKIKMVVSSNDEILGWYCFHPLEFDGEDVFCGWEVYRT